MPMIILDEDEIAALADRISDACDGVSAVIILAAMTDILAAIATAHPDLSMAKVMADFVGLAHQRHGVNDSQSLN